MVNAAGFAASLLTIITAVLRIAVPIYLYQQAKQRRLAQPWLWIVFGIFKPIGSLMLYYVVVHMFGKIREGQR